MSSGASPVSSATQTSARLSPLDAVHRAAQARMVAFGGWDMPLSYPSGTVAEHLACRSDAVVFDVSHLGTVRVAGTGALERLQGALTNDLSRIAPGRAQYTHLLDESDGSVLDDIIVWWVDPDRFDVMPNASNTSRVLEALGGADVTAERAILALQGPRARQRLATVAPDAAAVRRFGVAPMRFAGADGLVAGTGYTGEDGVECALPPAAAVELWHAVVGAGMTPAGLGARDTLRLEAALPLHGHELGPGITPLQAGLGWVVAWDKPGGFRGREALVAERQAGVRRHLVGLATPGRQPPREGYPIRLEGESIGELTSGNYSPVLGHGIGLALVSGPPSPGQVVELQARGRPLPATVVPLPFVPKKKG